jgi:hypothetical protein
VQINEKGKKLTNTFFMKTNSGFTEVQKNIPFSQLEQFHVEFVLLCEKEVLQKKRKIFPTNAACSPELSSQKKGTYFTLNKPA